MYKKFHLITGLCIIFNSFQVQPSSENTRAAIGIGLFTSSIICMKIVQHWNRPQVLDRTSSIPLIPSTTQTGPALSRVDNSNVQPAQQIHSDVIPAQQIHSDAILANHINQHDRRRNQNQYVSNSSNNSYRIATQSNNAKTPMHEINRSTQFFHDNFDSDEVLPQLNLIRNKKVDTYNAVMLSETIFSRSTPSPISSETTSESRTPSRSPGNPSRYTTPAIDDEYLEINHRDIIESQITDQIAEAKNKIIDEKHFEEKSMLLAEFAAQVNEYENDTDQSFFRNTLKTALEKEAHEVMAWQYNYEWIIGKTRTSANPLWTLQETEQLHRAQAIYQRLKSNQGEDLHVILSGYETLNNSIQQALLSAIEQGLKFKNIKNEARAYLQSKGV